MKKITLSITSILIGTILALTLVLVLYDKKREVYIDSSYNDVRLSLGKTKVKEINNVHTSSITVERDYYISDPYEFYENRIKTSEYYNSKLVFEGKYDYIYGYLIKDEVAFKYKIKNDYLSLSTMAVDHKVYSDYSLLLCDFVDFVGVNSAIGEEACSWIFNFEPKLIKYEDVVELYTHMNKDMVKINGDIIYLKGYDSYDLTMSNDYVIKIINKNGYPYGYIYEYPLDK